MGTALKEKRKKETTKEATKSHSPSSSLSSSDNELTEPKQSAWKQKQPQLQLS